jgi:uncharacterized membrane protein
MSRSTLAFLVLSLALGSPILARDITGTVSYMERIALPPGAELLVVASSPFGTPAELRVAPEGEVPLPFTLTTEDTMPLTLHAAIFSGGAQIWVSEDVAVPEGDAAVDLGAIRLNRHVPLGFAGTMLCGDKYVDVGFAGETLRVRIAGRVIDLAAEEAASGAKYGDGAGTVFWSKGNRATVTLDGVDLPECLPVIATTLPLTARGNEPGWAVTLTHQGLSYSGQDGSSRELPLPAASQTGTGTVFDSGDGLVLTLTDALCRDTMTGMPHPHQASLALDGQALSGCAGDPATLLAGTWSLVDLPGTTLPEGAAVTFEAKAGAIFGASGCNRYTGGLSLTGEGMSLMPGGMTMMACEEPFMQLEAAFIDRISRVGGFDIDAAGRLVLLVDGAPGAVFAR